MISSHYTLSSRHRIDFHRLSVCSTTATIPFGITFPMVNQLNYEGICVIFSVRAKLKQRQNIQRNREMTMITWKHTPNHALFAEMMCWHMTRNKKKMKRMYLYPEQWSDILTSWRCTRSDDLDWMIERWALPSMDLHQIHWSSIFVVACLI